MQNFLGIYQYSIDAKNRLAVPAKFRQSLGKENGLVLAQGLEGCLNLYTAQSWQKLNERLETVPLKNKMDQRAFKRMLFASACEIEFDEEGRVLIPQNLVEYANLTGDAVIIGMGEKIEIWAKALWEKYQKTQKKSFEKHASTLEI